MQLRNLRLSRLLLKIAHSNSFYPLSSIIQFFLDTIALSCTAMVVSYWRFVYQVHPDPMGATQDTVFRVIPLVFLIQAIVGYVVGIYRRRWRYGSFDEIAGLLTTTTISIAILLFLRFFDKSLNPYPRSVIVVGGFAIDGGVSKFAVARYTTTGALDTSFGTAGKSILSNGNSNMTYSACWASNNDIVVCGDAYISNTYYPMMAKMTSSGAAVTTFGTAGIWVSMSQNSRYFDIDYIAGKLMLVRALGNLKHSKMFPPALCQEH